MDQRTTAYLHAVQELSLLPRAVRARAVGLAAALSDEQRGEFLAGLRAADRDLRGLMQDAANIVDDLERLVREMEREKTAILRMETEGTEREVASAQAEHLLDTASNDHA